MEIARFAVTKRRSDMVRYDNHLYIGGQVATDLQGDIQAQTREVLAAVEQLLLRAGSCRERVLSVRILLAVAAGTEQKLLGSGQHLAGLRLDITLQVRGDLATDIEMVVVPDHVRTAFCRSETFNFHRAFLKG